MNTASHLLEQAFASGPRPGWIDTTDLDQRCRVVANSHRVTLNSLVRPFDHKVVFRRTQFQLAQIGSEEWRAIHALYAALALDTARNELIFNDILAAVEAGRSPVVITERKEHLELLAGRLSNSRRTSLFCAAA